MGTKSDSFYDFLEMPSKDTSYNDLFIVLLVLVILTTNFMKEYLANLTLGGDFNVYFLLTALHIFRSTAVFLKSFQKGQTL